MFSGSNTFLGGANSARPGTAPYLQQPYSQFPGQQQPQPQQPQPTGFAPQPTGYAHQYTGLGGPQLQPQPTGFAGAGQLQPQFTGFPPQQQQPQPQPQSFQLSPQPPQLTGYPPQNQLQSQPPQLQVAQSTGLPLRAAKTSNEIADSFSDGRPQPPPKTPSGAGNKIPSIRLSFITAQDQAKFEQLFKSAVGENQTMDGE